MNRRIILIDHHDNPRDDLLFTHLRRSGFEIDLRCPFRGDALPEITADVAGAAIYGGTQNVTEMDRFPFLEREAAWVESALAADLPLLGICLGGQLIAHVLGARVGPHERGLCEFGYYEITPTPHGTGWLPDRMRVTQAHFQQFEVPPDAVLLARGEEFPNQAFRYNGNVYALQFHPEATESVFRRWQDSDWACFDHPGAQSRQRQDELLADASVIQGDWFRNFLDQLFGAPARTPQPA